MQFIPMLVIPLLWIQCYHESPTLQNKHLSLCRKTQPGKSLSQKQAGRWGNKGMRKREEPRRLHSHAIPAIHTLGKLGQVYTLPTAAAKSLQSCPTLCDPIDGSLPGPSIHGIFQARVLEWVAIAFSRPPL